jgi:HK97 family phage prohead protease
MSRKVITSGDFKKYGVEKEYRAVVPIVKSVQNAVTIKNGKRYFKGYAGTVGRDRVRDNIVIDCWKKAKDHLMQPGANTVFFNHDTNIVLGRVVKTHVDDVGLIVKVLVSKAKDVSDYWTKIKEGILNALSIRLHPKKIEVVEDEATGKILEYKIMEMELFEVSVVGIPAQPRATINSVIGKSFNNAITRINKDRSKAMNKKKNVPQKKALTIDEQLAASQSFKALAEGQVQIAKALKGLNGQLNEIRKSTMTDEAKAAKVQADAKVAKKALKKAAGKNPALKLLASTMLDMKKQLAGLIGGGKRKGAAQEETADTADTGVVAKCLKSADDQNTVKYVLFLMGEDIDGRPINAAGKAAFAALSKEEQAIAKSFYGQMLMAALERE